MDPICEKCYQAFLVDQQLSSKDKDTLALELIGQAGLDFYDKWDEKYAQLQMAALNEVQGEDLKYALAKISLEDLPLFGTMCGDLSNKPFTPQVISFLQEHNVEFVLAIIEQDEYTVISLAAPLDEEAGEKFSGMIDNNGGSLRWDPSRVDTWAVYESE